MRGISTPAPNAPALRSQGRRERGRLVGLSVPALLLITGILFVPTGWLFSLSFVDDQGDISLANYARLVAHPSYRNVFQTTFTLSLVVTAASAAIGYPIAYMLSQMPRRWANLGLLAVLLPFWTSLLVRTYAWLVLLQRRGVVNNTLIALGLIDEPLRLMHNFTGAAIGMTHIMVPFLVLPLYASMRTIPSDYSKAAASLGASPARTFWDVFLPLSLPGLLAGGFLVFVLSLGFFVTPALLGGGRVIMIAMQIDINLRLYAGWGAASSLGVVLLVITLFVIYLAAQLAKFGLRAGTTK